ncbi:MAG: glutamine--tRNA ligase, partial [Candidatus Kryptoniota bacterium]
DVVRDKNSGEIIEVHCIYYPETRTGLPGSSKKVKGTIHWVSAEHSIDVEVRLYDRLFTVEDPGGDNWRDYINPDSLKIIKGCKAEQGLTKVKAQDRFQFERLGYFCVDDDSRADNIIFNRSVTLKDTWAKIEKSQPNHG